MEMIVTRRSAVIAATVSEIAMAAETAIEIENGEIAAETDPGTIKMLTGMKE
jgi:hypothetical protein